jgi:hypothetical protein
MSSDELSAFADVLQTLRSGETLLCVRGFTRLLLEKGGASKTESALQCWKILKTM